MPRLIIIALVSLRLERVNDDKMKLDQVSIDAHGYDDQVFNLRLSRADDEFGLARANLFITVKLCPSVWSIFFMLSSNNKYSLNLVLVFIVAELIRGPLRHD